MRRPFITAILITVGIFLPLLLFLWTDTIYGGDAGDLVVAAYVRGVPHPPGYPLYTAIAFLLTKLPFSTVAGRVALLSVFPALASLLFFLASCYLITRRLVASLITTIALGATYLFLLLAIIPEVFALHFLFISVLSFLVVYITQRSQWQLLWIFFLIFGLSLTHHHIILFAVPAFLYLLITKYKDVKKHVRWWHGGVFAAGLLPYLYVVFIARPDAPINWEHPQTMTGFIRLITRAVYGTFTSGIAAGHTPIERLFQIYLYGETVLLDATIVGVVLAIIGIVFLLIRQRRMGIFVLLGLLCTGPLFVFYAAFPFGNNFLLATVERFYLSSYWYVFVCVGVGITIVSDGIGSVLRKIYPKITNNTIALVFAVLPISLVFASTVRLQPLKHDRTAEQVGADVIATVPSESILLVTEDTRLFNTEYAYFVQGLGRNTTRFVQYGLLVFPYYQKYLHTEYPELILPEGDGGAFLVEFVLQNSKQFQIYADHQYPVGDSAVWVAEGLLFHLYSTDAQIQADAYLETNEQLFDQYQDPLAGALGDYRHLMLADVLRVYGAARSAVGDNLYTFGLYHEALRYFQQAVLLQPELVTNHVGLVRSAIGARECAVAEMALHAGEQLFTDMRLYGAGVELYTACFDDEVQTAEYQRRLDDAEQSERVPLDQLQ